MRYALMIKPHANARYAQSLQKIAIAELQCILSAWDTPAEVVLAEIAGVPFLTFEAYELSSLAWQAISGHSAICFAASVEDGLFRPVSLTKVRYLSDDLAEVLKYKGKTNVDFTAMMLHCAQAASDFMSAQGPLTVLDPLCGRGTTLFCAMREGHNAVGVEKDAKAVLEMDAYFSRYLKYHKLKHERQKASATLKQGRSAPEIRYAFANTPEGFKQGEKRYLKLFQGDTSQVDAMVGKESCHLLVADMPYGVQHAPWDAKGISTLHGLLEGAMSAYQRALKVGGSVALSFNTYTLSRLKVEQAMRNVGLNVQSQPPFSDFSHWVEQAVMRDFVVARKDSPSRNEK